MGGPRSKLESLAAETARRAGDAEPGSGAADREAGLHAGITAVIRGAQPGTLTRLRGSEVYVAGYLAGHLQGSLLWQRGMLSDELTLTCFTYGAALATASALPKLSAGDARALISAHTYSCIRLHQGGIRLSDRDERAIFEWLAQRAGVQITEGVVAQYERLRKRRTARLAGEAG
jgi:hypothetical protein